MTRVVKKGLLFALVIMALTTVLFVSASAADTSAEVQLNGEIMTFPSGVPPYYDRGAGRVFVPFRDLFEAMGADVEYDEATRLITATRGNRRVVFSQDGRDIYVTVAGEQTKITSDVAPITRSGRVLVPVRFVSNAMGANVGWDSTNATALVLDVYSLIAADTSTYEIFEKAAAIEQITKGNQETKLALKGDLGELVGSSLPFDIQGSIISSETAASGTVKGTIDLGAAAGVAGVTATLDIDAEFIANADTGVYGLVFGFLNENLGIPADTWLTITPDELLALTEALSEGYADGLLGAVSDEYPVREGIAGVVDGATIALAEDVSLQSIYSFDELSAGLDVLHRFLADDQYVKKGNSYVNTGVLTVEEVDINYSITIATDSAGNATSIDFSLTVSDEELSFKMTAHADKSTSKLSFALTGEDVIPTSIEITVTTAATTKKPAAALPSGAKTISILDIIDTLD
jgi:hypothetical protein